MYYPSQLREFTTGPSLVILSLTASAILIGVMYDLFIYFGRRNQDSLKTITSLYDATNAIMVDQGVVSPSQPTTNMRNGREIVRVKEEKLRSLQKEIASLKDFVKQLSGQN